MKTSNSKLFLILLFSASFFASNAQLVNIEEQRKNITPGWQGQIDFAFNLTQNTQLLTQFSNSASLQYTFRRHTFLILNDITFIRLQNSQQNIDIINKNFQHFRYNYNIDSNIFTYEFFIQRQQNKIKFIQYRFLTGTGLRIGIVKKENTKFYLAPLLMYEQEILSDSAHSFTRMLKGDLYLSFSTRINERVNFFHVTYYQPALFDFGSSITLERFKDFRLYSESELTVELIKDKIYFSLNIDLNYDSRPPDSIKDYPLFYSIKNKIAFKF